MWSNQSFDEPPETNITTKVTEFIEAIRNPNPVSEISRLSDIKKHFFIKAMEPYPEDLAELLNSGDPVSSGYITEISSYWISNTKYLYLISDNMKNCVSSPIPAPVITVGYVNPFIIVSHDNYLGLYSFPDLTPIECSFSFPKNVQITVIEGDIVGCNDGTLRRLSINNRRHHITVNRILSLTSGNAIKSIIKTKKYAIGLSINNVITFYEIDTLKYVNSTQLQSIIGIWTTDNIKVQAIDKMTNVFTITASKFKIDIHHTTNFLTHKQFHAAAWSFGYFMGIDSSRPSCDQLVLARFKPTPVLISVNHLGIIYSYGGNHFINTVLASSGLYQIIEEMKPTVDEELWKFSILAQPFWNEPISALLKDRTLLNALEDIFTNDNENISLLCKYLMTIVDDLQALDGTKFYQNFVNIPLSDFFSMKRTDLFSGLRKISFEIRLSTGKSFENNEPMTHLEQLIEEGNQGSEESSNEALKIILSSFQSLPTQFPLYCEFMLRHSYYKELIDAVCAWANSVMSDSIALAYENADCPTFSVYESTSYLLRVQVYDHLQPFLKRATYSLYNNPAAEALKKSLQYPNEIYQRFILQFFEDNCDDATTVYFYYPEMITQMRMICSKHLAAVYRSRRMVKEAYRQFIYNAKVDSEMNLDDRIVLLKQAKELKPDEPEVNQYLDAANVLHDFIEYTEKIPKNLFALTSYEIIEKLRNYSEYELALEVMKIFDEKRTDVLEEFAESATPELIKQYLKTNGVFSSYEVAQAMFYAHGKEKSIDFLVECGIPPRDIYTLFSQMGHDVMIQNCDKMLLILDSWTKVDEDMKQSIADTLCDIVIDIDSETAKEIRIRLGKCFLEQKFTDSWDI